MNLTTEQVLHIAQLARLELTGDELQRFTGQLSSILDYAARLQELDTSHIPPTSSVLPMRSVLRADEPAPGLGIEDVLGNAAQTSQQQFKVPPVLE